MAVTTGSVYADDSRNNVGAGDPSVTLIHPVLYKDRDMTISGQFRRYFPVSDWASNRNQQQYAYYMFTTYAFGHGVNAFNQLTPRFFQQSYYKPSDTHFMTEDYTTLTKQVASWFKYGLGQHTQIEWHDQTSMGQTVEVYPLADLVFSKNISVEPRYYLPVYSMNRVYDAPKSVSLGDSRAEIYMQITI
jgi:hypothetical protein